MQNMYFNLLTTEDIRLFLKQIYDFELDKIKTFKTNESACFKASYSTLTKENIPINYDMTVMCKNFECEITIKSNFDSKKTTKVKKPYVKFLYSSFNNQNKNLAQRYINDYTNYIKQQITKNVK